MKRMLVVAAVLAMVACDSRLPPAPVEKPKPIVVSAPAPAPVATKPAPAPVPSVKVRPRSAERAAYAKAKRNEALASCLREAADFNGDLYAKDGAVVNGTLTLPPGSAPRVVSRAACAPPSAPAKKKAGATH